MAATKKSTSSSIKKKHGQEKARAEEEIHHQVR